MTRDEVIKLGERELAKRQRREARDARFRQLAQRFAELVMEAVEKDKSCSIVAWVYKGEVGGEIFPRMDTNPCGRGHDRCLKHCGLTFKECMDLPEADRPDYVTASFERINREDLVVPGPSDIIQYQVWPFVGAWEGRIMNRVFRELQIPKNRILSLHYMDVRSVRGAVLCGEGVKRA